MYYFCAVQIYNCMVKKSSTLNQSGYNVSILVGDSISESVVSSRSEALRLTKEAEISGCFAWRITYLSQDYLDKVL